LRIARWGMVVRQCIAWLRAVRAPGQPHLAPGERRARRRTGLHHRAQRWQKRDRSRSVQMAQCLRLPRRRSATTQRGRSRHMTPEPLVQLRGYLPSVCSEETFGRKFSSWNSVGVSPRPLRALARFHNRSLYVLKMHQNLHGNQVAIGAPPHPPMHPKEYKYIAARYRCT